MDISKDFKKILSCLIILFVLLYLFFVPKADARSLYPYERFCGKTMDQIELSLKSHLPSGYEIVETHPSPLGKRFAEATHIRDTWISHDGEVVLKVVLFTWPLPNDPLLSNAKISQVRLDTESFGRKMTLGVAVLGMDEQLADTVLDIINKNIRPVSKAQSTRWRGESWYSPVVIPAEASNEEKNRLESFNKELANAKDAAKETNSYEMTDHIENAIKYRPEHPDNIRLEYKMAIAMTQYENDENKITPARRLKAINLYKKIADTYNHMDYYSNSLTDSQSIECPQFMVIRACNRYAQSRIENKDFKEAKKYAVKALDCLAETCKKRVSHYLNKPKPKRSPLRATLGAEEKYQRSVEIWKAMKERAKAGDVLGKREVFYAPISVRKYGMSYGDNQGFVDVVASMTEVKEKYRGTPMAKFAEEFIAKSKERMINRAEDDIFLGPDINTATPPTSAINDKSLK